MRNHLITFAAATVLLVAACGGNSQGSDTTAVPGSTLPEASTTTGGAGPGTTIPTTTPPSSEGDGVVMVTVDGTEYRLSAAEGITVGGAPFPSRCETNYFGTGMFWVVATAVDDNMARTVDPEVNLSLTLFPTVEAAEAADQDLEFELKVRSPSDSSQTRDYLIATDDSVVFQAGEYEGDLGSWTIDGNRIHGEITVYEYDHIREYFTATFDITCPSP
jgi:hypothetical protein